VNVPDRDKLLTGRPTGALIAVIGDDNDDFIFVGQQADFVASRDGMLFLSVNEGDLSDNSGAFRAHVAVKGAGAPAPASTARKGGGSQAKPRNNSVSASVPPANRTNNTPPPVSSPAPATEEPYASGPSTAGDPEPTTDAPVAKPAGSANAAVREANVVVQAKNDWTSTQIQVQRGARIRLSASGTVQLDKAGQRTASPSGVESVDRGKLIPDRPTGALIAVIGDDNDDFIFVGQQSEFVATRDGLLFLSINEGELSDNTGAFNVHVVVEQPRTVANR
jgi:hypothetical protein